MTGFRLKLIAVITMLIDHIGYVFFPKVQILRVIGRLAFPIFAFLIAEGARHTRDIRKYLIRLSIFALISELPFNLAFDGKFICAGSTNVFFTLAIGLLCIIAVMKFDNITLKVLTVAALVAFSVLINTDYSWYGVLMILGFYLAGNDNGMKAAVEAGTTQMYCAVRAFETGKNMLRFTQQASMLAIIPITLYNGERGYTNKALKYAFYAFYPMHLVAIWIINTVV